MTVKLTYNSPQGELEEINFENPLITVGSSQSNLLTIDSPNISPRHFVLEFIDSKWFIRNESQSEKITVNGIEIENAKLLPIKSNQNITTNTINILFEYDDKPPNLEHTKVIARKMIDEILQSKEHKEINLHESQVEYQKENQLATQKATLINDKIFIGLIGLTLMGIAYFLYTFWFGS